MKLNGVELLRVTLPLWRGEFRTSFGSQSIRDVLLVRVLTPDSEGWGECVAGPTPSYSSEYVDAAQHVIKHHLLPRLFDLPEISAHEVGSTLEGVKGHPMAKGAVEMAVLDAELRSSGESFGHYLGAVREAVDCGVSIGIVEDVPRLLDQVEGFLAEGYKRIKLKIAPGHDLEPVRAVREKFPEVLLQVDANAAYRLADARHLARLDDFDLLLIEQPLPEDQVRSHAELARLVRTPICLDESITSARAAADAIAIGAAAIVNIKAGRVGGYLEARRVHDVCAASGIPVWCGGMLETGIGRAANVALAALPNFTLPGDTSATDRYFERDITEHFVLENGTLRVPNGPGLGVNVEKSRLEELLTASDYVSAV